MGDFPGNPFARLDRRRFPGERRRHRPEKPAAAPGVQVQADDTEETLFQRAMRDVTPLAGAPRAAAPPAPALRTSGRRHAEADAESRRHLADLVAGRTQFTIEHHDEYILAHVRQMDPLILQQLRAGTYSPEAHLDLHGCTTLEAFDVLTDFVRGHYLHSRRCLLVVTGRGLNSPARQAVLKDRVQGWLTRDPFKRVLLAFCTAQPRHGGVGALYLLLRKHHKKNGKIVWDRPLDEDP